MSKFVLVFTFLTATFLGFSNSARHLKPLPFDSTTKLIDRTAALLLIEEGKTLYLEGKVREALLKFKLASNKDQNNNKVPYWVGLCHLRLNNYGYALQYALQAKEMHPLPDVDVSELLGNAYHRLNKLDSALIYFEYCKLTMPKQRLKDLRIEDKINECKLAQEWQKGEKKPKGKRLPDEINSGFNEYAPLLINGGKTLYFTSRRDNTTGGQNNPDDEQYFEDNYRAVWNESTKSWDSVSNDLDRVNGPGFDCISYIAADGLSGLMTLNTTATDLKEQTNGSDICEIVFSNKGKWQTPKVIKNKSINSSFFDGAATMTADGNTMYFVSDRNGDQSMTDIFVVQKVNKKWAKAVPVSDSINTPMRETTPYITPDGRFLFFSSDGHKGMGGYDIYVSENLGKTWSKPVNLGIEINTVNDDTHFQLYEKLKKALYAGYTIDGLKSSIDLFEVDLNQVVLPIK